MTRKDWYASAVDKPWRGPLLLWLLLTVIAVSCAKQRGVSFKLLPNNRQKTTQCNGLEVSALLQKYNDISTTLTESPARAKISDARRMLDQVCLQKSGLSNVRTNCLCRDSLRTSYRAGTDCHLTVRGCSLPGATTNQKLGGLSSLVRNWTQQNHCYGGQQLMCLVLSRTGNVSWPPKAAKCA